MLRGIIKIIVIEFANQSANKLLLCNGNSKRYE